MLTESVASGSGNPFRRIFVGRLSRTAHLSSSVGLGEFHAVWKRFLCFLFLKKIANKKSRVEQSCSSYEK
jgi:hypothetical protein